MDKDKKKKLLAIRNAERKKGNYNSYAEIFDTKNNQEEEDFPKNANDITKDELHEHFDLDNDGKVTLDEYAEHINYHCKNPEVLEEEFEKADFDKGFKYAKGGIVWKKNIGDDGWSSTMENESAYDNEGGYISESGNWKIYRQVVGYTRREDGEWNYKRDGYWIVMGMNEYGRVEDFKGEFETLSEAKKYVERWIEINPEDYAKGGKTKEAKTWKQKYNKKYGNDLEESNSLSEISEDTGVSKKGIQKIYNKGIGAYKTNPSSVRPNVKSKEQWAQARVYSAVMGGKAAKVDAKELKMEKGGEINDWYISLAERVYFVNYMSDFYSDKGIYAEDYDGGFTNDQIEIAVDKYIQDPKTNWGGGDSVDRELTRDRYLIPAYAEGGALSKEFKFDKNFVIYVPSTSNVGDKISNEELEERVNEVETYVANEFGGYTETDTDGGYKSTSGEIIEEDIVKVSVFANNDDWNKNESKVVSKVKEWAKRWGQEAIGFEYEGDLYYIDEGGKCSKGGTIKCNSCSWSWNEKDGGDDMYVCHKCGNDNSEMYSKGGLSPDKAKEMLNDGMAQGKPLTEKQIKYFGAISSGKEDKIREVSRMKRGGKTKKRKLNKSLKDNYGLDYLYNQLKISKENLSKSLSNDDKEINLFRVQSIKKLIDKNLNNIAEFNH